VPDFVEPPLFEGEQDLEQDFNPTNVMDNKVGPSSVETATAQSVSQTKATRPVAAMQRPTRACNPVKSYVPSMSGKTYEYATTQLALTTHHPQIVEMILSQLMLKAAINKWGKRAETAAVAEMKQLHWRNTFKPVNYNDLNTQQRQTILESHIFLQEKRMGKIKGCTVASGNKQRSYIEKEDASSLTVATESVIVTSVVDAEENRDVAVLDIPNAFIQTVVFDKKRRVIIQIRGMLVDILVKLAPNVYGPYVTTDKKGNKQILVECLNAIYGTMVAGLLYYEKFTDSLAKNGYEVNPYDACVWNKMIEGKQCTICFHVDNCKISHVDKKVVDNTIKWLCKDYESIFEDGMT
jgi:hypothetical protein